jgi:hypothetical protein
MRSIVVEPKEPGYACPIYHRGVLSVVRSNCMESYGVLTTGIAVGMTNKRSSAFQVEWMKLVAWRPSVSFTLVLASISANLLAFTLSLHIPSGASEVNPLVHPGLLASLGYSEGIIVLVSFVLTILIPNEEKRSVVLAAVVAVLTGDALNDIVYTLTRSQFLAADISYTFTALIPAFVAMKWIQSQTS